jgi:hypothetical protein
MEAIRSAYKRWEEEALASELDGIAEEIREKLDSVKPQHLSELDDEPDRRTRRVLMLR